MSMDDVNERLEELALTAISDSYSLKAGSSERQREINNIEKLVVLLRENEDSVHRRKMEEERIDMETIKNRDEIEIRRAEIERELKSSKKRLIIDIIRCAGSEIGVPLMMLADEHSDRLLPNRIFRFWSKPKI